jgi:hypothetical protein
VSTGAGGTDASVVPGAGLQRRRHFGLRLLFSHVFSHNIYPGELQTHRQTATSRLTLFPLPLPSPFPLHKHARTPELKRRACRPPSCSSRRRLCISASSQKPFATRPSALPFFPCCVYAPSCARQPSHPRCDEPRGSPTTSSQTTWCGCRLYGSRRTGMNPRTGKSRPHSYFFLQRKKKQALSVTASRQSKRISLT